MVSLPIATSRPRRLTSPAPRSQERHSTLGLAAKRALCAPNAKKSTLIIVSGITAPTLRNWRTRGTAESVYYLHVGWNCHTNVGTTLADVSPKPRAMLQIGPLCDVGCLSSTETRMCQSPALPSSNVLVCGDDIQRRPLLQAVQKRNSQLKDEGVCRPSPVPMTPGWSTVSFLLSAYPTYSFAHLVSGSVLLCGCNGANYSLPGIRTPEQQRAWREKMGLLSIILSLMTGVGFLTFGFTRAVCGKPSFRTQSGDVGNASVIIHGLAYDFSNFKHPAAGSTFDGQTNPLIQGGWGVAGNDISFMFQNVNGRCKGLFAAAPNSTITSSGGDVQWYFPCNVYNQFGTSGVNQTGYGAATSCHVTGTARDALSKISPAGQVFYTWDQVRNPSRNLAVFES